MGVWEIITIIGSFLAAVTGILTYFERRERRREQRAEQQEKELIEKISTKIISEAVPMWEGYFEKQREELVHIHDFFTLEDQVQEQKNMLISFEKNRIKAEIMDFSEDLKNGIKKSSVAYQHIHEVYSKYKKLGGNSYIQGVFEYILGKQKEKENRFRKNDTDPNKK